MLCEDSSLNMSSSLNLVKFDFLFFILNIQTTLNVENSSAMAVLKLEFFGVFFGTQG